MSVAFHVYGCKVTVLLFLLYLFEFNLRRRESGSVDPST